MTIKTFVAAVAVLTFTLGAAQAEGGFPQLGKSYGGKLRSGPGMQFDQVGSTRDGDEITILNPTSVMMNGYEWFQIRDAQGRVGFQWGGLFCSQYASPVIYKTCPELQPYKASQPAAPSGAAFPNVSGFDAKTVEYANGFFTQSGTSAQGVGLWYEAANTSGNSFDFVEVARDEWSVYLKDPSRDVRIQLDMWRGEILYASGNAEMRPLYDIIGADTVSLVEPTPLASRADAGGAAFPDHSGYSVAQVIHSAGAFTLLETVRGRVWEERDQNGQLTAMYRELGQDDWSVYLYDPKSGRNTQLDLWQGKIYVTPAGGTKQTAFTIDTAASMHN